MVPGGSQLSGVLPATRVPVRVTVPSWLTMPPPTLAELWSTELPRMTAGPPLAMPPAALPGSVAVLWSTRLPLRVRLLPLTGESRLPGPLAIPAPLRHRAGDAANVGHATIPFVLNEQDGTVVTGPGCVREDGQLTRTRLSPENFAASALQSWPYWSPARTDVMRCVLKPSQCIRPT